jgi:predicted nucleotidyltransferase component of viral defense system
MSVKPYNKYYKDLYVIQDEVFNIVEHYDFYLTGGTALSRFYLDHRYSDDLDFFVHQKKDFLPVTREIITKLKAIFRLETQVLAADFAQILVYTDEFSKKYQATFQAKLKVDFVNEQEIPRIGELNSFTAFSRVDNLRNILSNKITALTRLEPKDVADIWFICKSLSFNWDEIIHEAEKKEVIEELMIFDLLKTFPLHMFKNIRWVNPVKIEDFERDREIILKDLLTKSPNSLFLNNQNT